MRVILATGASIGTTSGGSRATLKTID